MLKSCPSCSYIGNDSEHVCPFCKAALAFGKIRKANRAHCMTLRSFGDRKNESPVLFAAFSECEL